MSDIIKFAKEVLLNEAEAVAHLASKLDNNFINACNIINKCSGKVVVMGMGKSGHIANKIAATFASTGIPSFFVHPAEAGHGDLGMLSKGDIVLFISYSGAATEIITLLPMIKKLGIKTIIMSGNRDAVITNKCDVFLDVSVSSEACPHNLAPTTSTTVALAMGDALAISLLKHRGFSADDFARSHPSGILGRKLLTFVSDIMQKDDNLPIITQNIKLLEALIIMSEKKLGMLVVVGKSYKLLGIFTDGDLRRVIKNNININNLNIFTVMTKNPKFISSNKAAIFALEIMEKFKINCLPVVDNNKVVGAININTLIQEKII